MNNQYIYEKIDHSTRLPFKCFVTSIKSSCPHWHSDYEIIFLLKGEISLWDEGRKYKMKEGDLLLINSKNVHSIRGCQDGNIILFIQFHPKYLLNYLDIENRRYKFYLNSCEEKNKIKKSFYYFKELAASIGLIIFEEDPVYKFYSLSKFYQFLGDLLSYIIYDIYYVDESQYSDEDQIILDKLMKFIKDNYMEDLKTEDICDYLGVSTSTLYRYMNDRVGISVKSLITYYRMEEAKSLLINTKYSISHIADLCGYSSQATFYRVFKKEFHITPNEFRERGEKRVDETDQGIKGYVDFNNNEAYELMIDYINKV